MNILLRVVQEIYEIGHVMTQVLTLSDVVDEDPCTFERNMIIFVSHLCSALLNVNPEVYIRLTLVFVFLSIVSQHNQDLACKWISLLLL